MRDKTKTRFLPFLEAREIVRALGLKSKTEWGKYSKTERPYNIPGNPYKIYKNQGWISCMDWLGYVYSRKGKFLPFLEAREFVRFLGLKNVAEWLKYSQKDRPLNIPSNPDKIYKGQGWTFYADWLGCVSLQNARKYKVNDNYFKTWSSNMAYILGFWFADGCITHTKYSKIFSISQHKKDKYLLEAVLKEMNGDYPLAMDRDCCHFSICSKTIYDDIIKLGGKERKSFDVKFPYVPEKYLPDFIRGLWDGDGSIYYCKQVRSYASSYSSASKELIDGLYCALKKMTPDLKGAIYKQDNEYSLRFGKNDTIRLKKIMYQEPLEGKLMLKRKHDLFLKIPDYCSRDFLDYNDAQKIVRLLDFKCRLDWQKNYKTGKIPHHIPHNPYLFYKNSGWVDWGTWLGYKPMQNNKTSS